MARKKRNLYPDKEHIIEVEPPEYDLDEVTRHFEECEKEQCIEEHTTITKMSFENSKSKFFE